MKISEISKFLILPYTQDRKVGNLRNLTLIVTQDLKTSKKLTDNKNKNFRDFQVFDFALYPKSKTRKSQKVFFYFKFRDLLEFQIQTQQKWTDTKI